MKFKRINLPYSYDSLEPYIDAKTVEVHYEKHHKGYETNLNKVISNSEEEFATIDTLEDLMKNYSKIKEPNTKIRVREFGGGLINHNFLWTILKKDVPFNNYSAFGKKLIKTFGGFKEFQIEFEKGALSVFGSGWYWLILDKNNELQTVRTLNQDNPWFANYKPLLAIDVWEHAYYLKYQSNRSEYIKNYWNVIDWEKVGKLYDEYIASSH